MSGVVIHVGLPKTGTTTLQKAVFPHLDGVHYAGKHIPGYGFTDAALGAAIAATISADSALRDPVPALREAVDAARARAGTAVLVISTESLAHPSARDLGLVADRLAAAVPDARILVTIRAQEALALSWYRSHGRFAQYLFTHKRESERIPPHLGQEQWWALVSREPVSGLCAVLDFEALVSCYRARFGGRVAVLPLELLAADRARYAQVLGTTLGASPEACGARLEGVRENPGLSSREVVASRVLSLLGIRADFLESRDRNALRRWLASGPRADAALEPAIASELRARYAAGNARLASTIAMDLAALGYSAA